MRLRQHPLHQFRRVLLDLRAIRKFAAAALDRQPLDAALGFQVVKGVAKRLHQVEGQQVAAPTANHDATPGTITT